MIPAVSTTLSAALEADGPTTEYPARMARFGRLVGSWEVRGTRLDEASGEWEERAFTWVVGYILDGRAVQDVELVERPGHPGEYDTVATAVRVYDKLAGAWRVSFFAPTAGEYCHLVATSYRDGIRQDGTQTDERPIRWNFSNITDDSFSWDGWVSNDSGATWVLTEHVDGMRLS